MYNLENMMHKIDSNFDVKTYVSIVLQRLELVLIINQDEHNSPSRGLIRSKKGKKNRKKEWGSKKLRKMIVIMIPIAV